MWHFVQQQKNETHHGQVECDGLLISFSFKLFILAIGTWAVFYRSACNGSNDKESWKQNLIWPHLSYLYSIIGVHELLCRESTSSEASSPSSSPSSLWPSGCSTLSGGSTPSFPGQSHHHRNHGFELIWYLQYRIIWEFVFSPGWWNSGENFNTPTSSDMLPPS